MLQSGAQVVEKSRLLTHNENNAPRTC